jgi:signal transduction histidine kinase
MRLKQLSEDMFKYSLAFCDTEDGVKLEEYDAETLWQQLLAEHILLITERGFTIDNKLPSFGLDGMMVRTDPTKLMRIVDNIFSNLSKYADRKFPIEIKVGKVGSYAVMECKNRIASEPATTESNGIGLKTCTRLARAVADSFYYGEEEGLFVTRLYMKLYSEGNKNDKL